MNQLTTTDQKPKLMLLDFMADKYSLNVDEFSKTVRNTCGLPSATAEQFAAFLIVAKEYNLNPLTKEIYAFPGRGGIVPIVSIDGWVNLVNSHGQCDGFEFEFEEDGDKLISATCRMFRKDRKHPVTVTEYYSECVRATEPWKMKHRMLRHKAFIQAARYAFGFSGIYDEDEGQKIAESGGAPRDAGPPRDSGPPSSDGARLVAAAIENTAPNIIEGEVVENQTPAQERDEQANEPTEQEQGQQTFGEKPEPDTTPKAVEPYALPTDRETFASLSEKYITALQTSTAPGQVFDWASKNQKALDQIAAGAPEIWAKIKKASEAQLVRLRGTQPAADKKPAAEKPKRERKPAKGKDVDGPEGMLAKIETELAAVEHIDALEGVWANVCEPLLKDAMPPDVDVAQGIYQTHFRRLGGD